MKLSPLLCGLWDTCHLWVQWNDPGPDSSCFLQWCERTPGGDWKPWQDCRPINRHWIALPIWRAGHEVQARVALAVVDGEPLPLIDWELAQEVTFSRSRCHFSITSGRRSLHFPKESTFTCVVDGAACTYRITADLEVPVGVEVLVEMESLGLSGYHQLDHAGHFTHRPGLGIVVTNIEPSVDDTVLTGRNFTVMAQMSAGPMIAAIRKATAH